jgi:hypothetical protein
MTELMKQLQAWANEGRYDFEGKRFKTPCAWVDMENPNPKQLKILREHYGYYEITDYILDKIKCVLDGTIQVWRPVDKYEPKAKEDFLISVIYKIGIDGRTKRGYRKGCIGFAKHLGTWHFKDGKGDLELDSIATHYQPLPQPPQEVSHA